METYLCCAQELARTLALGSTLQSRSDMCEHGGPLNIYDPQRVEGQSDDEYKFTVDNFRGQSFYDLMKDSPKDQKFLRWLKGWHKAKTRLLEVSLFLSVHTTLLL